MEHFLAEFNYLRRLKKVIVRLLQKFYTNAMFIIHLLLSPPLVFWSDEPYVNTIKELL